VSLEEGRRALGAETLVNSLIFLELRTVQSLNYAEIIKKTVNAATIDQPSIQAIKLYPVCDLESGNFVVLATGRDKQCWMDSILFHARLIEKDNGDRQIIIEEDNFEEGLVDALIEAGIKKEDIVTSWQQAIAVNK
jgi:hypothetical protein